MQKVVRIRFRRKQGKDIIMFLGLQRFIKLVTKVLKTKD